MRTIPLSLLTLCLGICPTTANADKLPRSNDAPTVVRVVESSEERNTALEEKPSIQVGATRAPELTIQVNDALRFQTIDGFGASLTDSSAWLLWNKLTEPQRKETLQKLFDPAKGIGLSLLRQPVGTSDFGLTDYSYDDVPPGQTDPDLKNFSIEKDNRYILPLLREALAINPNLRVMASPWSPPAWMKTSQSLIQGALLPTAYKPLANYFVRYIQAYEKAGVPIYAVTPQNEPLNVPDTYPGMNMAAGEQAVFVRDFLGPALRDARLNTKILIFDHNWSLLHYPIELLSDPKAAASVSGIAVHCYGGTPAAQAELHERFPDKDIWFTECSGGDWQKGNLLEQQVRLMISTTRNWSRSVILWNLALDQNHEPHLGGCTNCRGIVTIKHGGAASEVVPTVDFTALGHLSKFLRPGAQRIESNTFAEGSLEDVAFRNPDGSLVLLVLNSSAQPTTFNISWHGQFATYTLSSLGVATFTWSPTALH